MKNILISLLILFTFNIENDETYFQKLKKGSYNEAILLAKSNHDDLLVKYAEMLFFDGNKEKEYFDLAEDISSQLSNVEQKIISLLIKGKLEQNYSMNNLNAFKFYFEALEKAEVIDNRELTKQSLILILSLYEKEIFYGNNQHETYLKKLEKLRDGKIDEFIYIHFRLVFLTKTIYELDPVYENVFNQFDSIYKVNEQNSYFSTIYFSEKGLRARIENKTNEAITNFTKALSYTTDDPQYKIKKFALHLNIGDLHLKLNQIKKAQYFFNEARKYFNSSRTNYDLFYYHRFVSDYFSKKKDFDSAYYHLNKSLNIEYDLEYKANALEISQLNKLYQTEKKEKENILLKQNNIQNRNLLIGSILIIIFGGTIGYLNLKNSRKKRLLAEQQKQLEKQKNLTLLKEQEITTINAMIEGQEKERVRIAEDLHDNIGSVLATLKLHFENLKLNREKKHFNQEELYFKTEGLIDETYKKVRSIAHAKNAGVIANQGLLVAIKIMAEKISSANQLKIEVLDFGLENRIENTIELTVFRIVQELITNIIKHAEAENATISLSLFDNTLNVIVEDDGKGFVYKKENNVDGMGLGSINTRIKHLNGDFTVDSTIGNGTSIIIDIPIL